MTFIEKLEKRKIITSEMLKIFCGSLYFLLLGWYFIKLDVSMLAMGSFFIYFGGMANLCVMNFNNFAMPIAIKNEEEFRKVKERNSDRKICMLGPRSRLKILADRFYIINGWHSMGDFILYVGFLMILLNIFTLLIV